MAELDQLKSINFFSSLGNFKQVFSEAEPIWCALSRIDSFLEDYNLDKNGNYISQYAQVHRSAIVQNSYIGDRVRIYEFVNVRGSLVGPDTVIGHCSEVARSIILSKCSIPRFNYIGSSIVGNNVRFGGVCSLASRRFDDLNVFIRDRGQVIQTNLFKFSSIIGDNCLVGFSVHCNPGTVIGKNCIIMPQVELKGIIPAESVVSAKQKLIISRKRSLSQLGIADLKRYVEES